jgi:hypothetical protein
MTVRPESCQDGNSRRFECYTVTPNSVNVRQAASTKTRRPERTCLADLQNTQPAGSQHQFQHQTVPGLQKPISKSGDWTTVIEFAPEDCDTNSYRSLSRERPRSLSPDRLPWPRHCSSMPQHRCSLDGTAGTRNRSDHRTLTQRTLHICSSKTASPHASTHTKRSHSRGSTAASAQRRQQSGPRCNTASIPAATRSDMLEQAPEETTSALPQAAECRPHSDLVPLSARKQLAHASSLWQQRYQHHPDTVHGT